MRIQFPPRNNLIMSRDASAIVELADQMLADIRQRRLTAGDAYLSAADAAKVKCEGANACKGKSACHTATSGCQGQNSCKGKGYLMLTKAECDATLAKMKSEKK